MISPPPGRAVRADDRARGAHGGRSARHITVLTSAGDWGGTEEVTLGLLETLEQRGHTTTLVDLREPVYATPIADARLRTTHRHVPLEERLDRLSAAGYARLLRSAGADICVLSKGDFTVHARTLDVAARTVSARYVTIEHLIRAAPGGPAPRVIAGLPLTLNLAWYRRRRRGRRHLATPDAVVCVSEAVRARLAADFDLDSRAVVVHNGVDTTAFRFDADAYHRVRRQWGVPPGALVFGMLARLAPVKAPAVALEQFAALHAEGAARPTWLVLAGDGPERPELEARAAALGLTDRVLFPGWVAREARPATVSAFDVFLMPSRREGLPLSLMEAMAAERACVAFDVGGIREVLSDASLGWLIPAGDTGAFGRAMRQVASMPEADRRQMGRRARGHVERRFERGRQLARLADVVLGAPELPSLPGAGRG